MRELESHQAAPDAAPQLASLQRQLQDSRRAEADVWGQLELLREVSGCVLVAFVVSVHTFSPERASTSRQPHELTGMNKVVADMY